MRVHQLLPIESGISGENHRSRSAEFSSFFFGATAALVRLFEGDRVHDLIKQRLVSSLGSAIGAATTVLAIHRNPHSGAVGQARLHCFQIFSKTIERKCGSNANVRYAWFSPSSVDKIARIVSHGFSDQFGKLQMGEEGGRHGMLGSRWARTVCHRLVAQ